MRGDTKRNRINRVLGWSSEPVSIPERLANSLDTWFFNIGAGASRIDCQLGTQIEVVEQWKQLQPEESSRVLNDAWAFKEFLSSRHFISETLVNGQNKGQIEKEILLHLAFPDEFEAIGAQSKDQIANAANFARFVKEQTQDVDRKLQQIRHGIEATRGDFDDFWTPGIKEVWQEGQPLNGGTGNESGRETKHEIDLSTLADQLYLPAKFLDDIYTLLAEKKQVISKLDFTHFKRHKRGNLQYDGTEWREFLYIGVGGR